MSLKVHEMIDICDFAVVLSRQLHGMGSTIADEYGNKAW